MTVPEIRKRLEAVSLQLRELAVEAGPTELIRIADQIDWLRAETRRRRFPGARRTVSPKATPELRQEIREFAQAHPHLLQIEIANRFGVNAGRVSEALHGWRR